MSIFFRDFVGDLFTLKPSGKARIPTPIKILIELKILCKKEDFGCARCG
jgi:hypothetical protein